MDAICFINLKGEKWGSSQLNIFIDFNFILTQSALARIRKMRKVLS